VTDYLDTSSGKSQTPPGPLFEAAEKDLNIAGMGRAGRAYKGKQTLPERGRSNLHQGEGDNINWGKKTETTSTAPMKEQRSVPERSEVGTEGGNPKWTETGL